jgi:16S rRNA (cytosine967-C5)-methyltransferase
MNRARALAFRALSKFRKDGSYTNLETNAVLEKNPLSEEDKNLFTKLFLGVVEKRITLDFLLSRLSSIPLNTLSEEVLSLLEMGLYQILYLDRIPDRAAIFETVELAKKHTPEAAGFLNAVLRRASAEKESLPEHLKQSGKKGLSLRYSYPRWLVSLWCEAYGKEKCEEILIAQNCPPPLTLRVNTLKISLEELEKLLTKAGIPFHRNPLCKNAVTLEKNMHPASLFGFEEGLFFVQDAAAGSAIDRLDIKKGQKVLDVCAAPGGKSFAAACDLKNEGEILAFELHKSRLSLIEEGANRLGIRVLQAQENDSSIPRADLIERFDRVICDVPCSGYGTIAKKPDIRHKKKEEAESLPALQFSILKASAEALKTGGRILYSTCTLSPEENEGVTNAFLAQNSNFIRIGSPETVFPKGGENDGFFHDLLEKIK